MTKKEKQAHEVEIGAYNHVLSRIHDALKPAQKMWQKAHNKPLTWPDTCELIKWLTRRARK